MTVSFRQLQYLCAIQKTSSFSKAAEHCFVTQSTLSAGIKELENILRAELINRSNPRNIQLTPLGKTIQDKAEDILSDLDSLKQIAQQSKQPLSGPLRLGVIPTIAPYLLPRILPDIQKRYPDLQLELQEDLSETLMNNLELGLLDIILIALPYNTKNFETLHLFDEAFHVAAPKGAMPAKPVTRKMLEQQDLLLLADGHCLNDHALGACNIQKSSTRRGFSATSLATLIQMVQHGYGITLLPQMVVDTGALPSSIDILPLKSTGAQRGVGLVCRKNNPATKDFELLASTIKELHFA